jgi:hypothetical protein
VKTQLKIIDNYSKSTYTTCITPAAFWQRLFPRRAFLTSLFGFDNLTAYEAGEFFFVCFRLPRNNNHRLKYSKLSDFLP